MSRSTLSPQEVTFVNQQPVGRLATADGTGQPHVVPVCFVYLVGKFFIAIDEKPKRTVYLKRLRNIAENARVALVIDVYQADWSQLAWLMVQGEAVVNRAGRDQPDALVALRQKYPPYRAMALEDRPLLQIEPVRVLSWGLPLVTSA